MLDSPVLIDRRNEIMERLYKTVEVRDLGHRHNNQPSPCHIWTGADSGTGRGGGYGRMSLNGQTTATHLIAYTHYYGYIPSKRQIDHLCGNRLCCNPQHLELVTHLQNQRRRAQRAKLNL